MSLLVGMMIGIVIFFCWLFDLNKPIYLDISILILLIIVIPAYLILPGIIYRPFKRKRVLEDGINTPIDQIIYYSLTILTLGIAPSLIYFIKYDAYYKKMCNGERTGFGIKY